MLIVVAALVVVAVVVLEGVEKRRRRVGRVLGWRWAEARGVDLRRRAPRVGLLALLVVVLVGLAAAVVLQLAVAAVGWRGGGSPRRRCLRGSVAPHLPSALSSSSAFPVWRCVLSCCQANRMTSVRRAGAMSCAHDRT